MVGAVNDPPYPPLRPILTRGEGVHVWDVDGHRFLDAVSGSFCVQLGYGRADLVRAAADAAGRLPFARPSVFESEESEAYAQDLLQAAGPPFTRVILTTSGSEAVEAAFKAAYFFQAGGKTLRARMAHLRGHFHGATVEAMRYSDYRARRAPYEFLLGPGHPTLDPGDPRALEEGLGDACALIAETVPAVGLGVALPPPGALARIRRACDAQGAVWIADEVLTGFGRVGSLFAWQRLAERPEDAGAVPDLVAFGKGAGAGYAGLGGVLVSGRVAASMDRFRHAQTYGGHAIACAVGRRVLAALREEGIEERVRSLEDALREALEPLAGHEHVREVRGLGFLWGLTLRESRATGGPFPRELRIAERVEAACRERGLLVYGGSGADDGDRGDHLLVAPPLVSAPHHFAQIAIGIRQALDEVIRDTRSPGLSPA